LTDVARSGAERRPALVAEGAVFELLARTTTIGRDPDCTICLARPGISRRHAEVTSKDDGFWIADLGSANGTRVNGSPCKKARRLAEGDVLELGETRLRFVEDVPPLAMTERPKAPVVGNLAALVGESPAMTRVRELVTRMASADTTVLVLGETGTGKELVASALHAESPRRSEPFVAVNSAALSESLLLSELFGHEKGAFTGAAERRAGQFEAARRGTIFLDEIGELTLPAQASLLRVLESGEFRRLGGTETLETEARVVCATNRPLAKLVAKGAFREDLWHRIRVLEIELPPLRERPGDLVLLARKFTDELSLKHGRATTLSDGALERLRNHAWPGNVRELKHAIERALVVSRGSVLEAADFSLSGAAPAGDTLEEKERAQIVSVLERTGWNIKRSAEILGVHRRTLYSKIEHFGLERP
jgi:transcriptional regulator with GAF, ATPase, and Fis domain